MTQLIVSQGGRRLLGCRFDGIPSGSWCSGSSRCLRPTPWEENRNIA